MPNIKNNTIKNILSLIFALCGSFIFMLIFEHKLDFDRFINATPNIPYAIICIALFCLFKVSFGRGYRHYIFVQTSSSFMALLSIMLIEYNEFGFIGSFYRSPLKGSIVMLFLGFMFVFYNCLLNNMFIELENIIRNNKVKHFSFLKTFLLVIIFHTPIFILLFPGTISFDSGYMLQIAYGLQTPSHDNPLLPLALMHLLAQLANISSANFALAFFTFLQIVIQSLLIASLLHKLIKKEIANSIVIGIFAFCLSPVFTVFSVNLGKDNLFGYSILYMLLSMYEVIENKIDKKSYINIFISAILCSLTRNIGIYLVLCSSVPLCLYMLFKQRKHVLGVFLSYVLAVVLVFFGTGFIVSSLHIKEERKSANLSIPLQHIARIAHVRGVNSFSKDEFEHLSKGLDLYKAAELYNPTISDPIKDIFNEDISDEDFIYFKKAWKSVVLRHKRDCLAATFYNSLGYFIPGIKANNKPTYFWGFESTYNLDKFKPSHNLSNVNIAKGFVSILHRMPLLDLILSIGFVHCMHYLCLFGIIACKKYKYILLILPSIFYGIGLIASPVNAYLRYALPLFYTLPLSFGLMVIAMRDELRLKGLIK